MRRFVSLGLGVLLLVPAVALVGCSESVDKDMTELVRRIDSHGHNRTALLDRKGGAILMLYLYLKELGYKGINAESSLLGSSDALMAPIAPSPPGPMASRQSPDRAASPFFDHPLDGAWQGRSNVWWNTGSGKLPFLLLANASEEKVFLSLLFLDLAECVTRGETRWTVVYTDKVDLDPNGRLHFEKVASSFLAPLIPDILDLDFTYSAYVNSGRFTGSGEVSGRKGPKPLIRTSDEFFKLEKPGRAYGLWSTGFSARVYAGEFLDPPMYHPTVLGLVDRNGRPELDLFVLFDHEANTSVEVEGKRVRFDFWTPNGIVDGDFEVVDRALTGQIWDPLHVMDRQLTLDPAATRGKTPKVKRVKPKAIAVATPGRIASLTVIGKDFVPGSMVFFDQPELELLSVEFVSKKKLKVKVSSPDGLPTGTRVGVLVLNPDNRSAEKARAFRTR